MSSLHEVAVNRKIVKCSPHLVRAVSAPTRPVFDGRQRLQLTDIVIHREVVLKGKIIFKYNYHYIEYNVSELQDIIRLGYYIGLDL